MIIFWICVFLFAVCLEGVAMYGYLEGKLTGRVTVTVSLNIIVLLCISFYFILKHAG